MLYAKISPAAQVVKQNGPFNTTVKSAEYASVAAIGYVVGAPTTGITVTYGTPQYDAGGNFIMFDNILTEVATLTPEEFAQWGTDDSYLLTIAAEKQGFTILEVIDSNVPITTTTTSTTIL